MKTLSLIIPTYNEANRIEKTLKALKGGFNFNGIKIKEIIFSDDGSTDETVKKINKHKKEIENKTKARVKILTSKTNKGRGYAIKKAALISNSDYVLYTDADFSITLENLKKFIPYMRKDFDVIIGSKKIRGAKEIIKRSLLRKIIGYGHSFVAYFILGVFVWDFQGGFKVFSRKFVSDVFPYLKIDRWGFDMEVIFLAKKLGYKLKELPVKWGDIERDSKVKLLRDIIRSIKEMLIIKANWISGNYQKSISPRFALKLS